MKGFKSITIIFLLAVGLLTSVAFNPPFAENPMRITVEEAIVSIHADESVLLSYRYGSVAFKPYVRHLFSPCGVNVLRDAPADHLHHHGLMFAVKVDGVSFWEERQAAGRQAHRSLADMRVDKSDNVSRASFTERIDWLNPPSQEVLLKEERTIGVCRMKDLEVTLLTWQSKFQLPSGKEYATLTGAHYHGLGMRFLKSMDADGQFRNAAGKTGEVVRGDERLVRSIWCAYTANANGKPVTVAMFDHPENPRHPAAWFTMAKPFAYLSATLNLHKEPLRVDRCRPLVLRYAVALWDGQVEADKIGELYQRWTTCLYVPPTGNNDEDPNYDKKSRN